MTQNAHIFLEHDNYERKRKLSFAARHLSDHEI